MTDNNKRYTIHISLTKETYERLKKLLAKEYGEKKRAISLTVEKLVREFLDRKGVK